MPVRTILMIAALLVAGAACEPATGQERDTTDVRPDSVDHSAWHQLLQHYVDREGDVDYGRLHKRADSVLTPYLQQLAAARPSELDPDARLALWINAYNAYTLKLITEHYPVTSIQEIEGPGPDKTPFQRPVGEVADTVRTLDEIEHEIIRVRFDEPRIHFALVCAAKSCPRLRRNAYEGPSLDRQLDQQTLRFLTHKRKNRIPGPDGTIELSPIFKWYGSDFGPDEEAIQRYLATYFDGSIRESLRDAEYDVEYLSYDWTLNDQTLDWGDAPTTSDDE